MAYKILAVLALAAVASALDLHHAAPSSYVEHHAAPAYHKAAPSYISHHGNHGDHHEPEHYHDSPPHYEFAYSVHDEHSGDVKTQQESRKDDVVHGSYSLIDADGYKRTVEYTADDVHGFQATVHREPLHHHAGPAEHEHHY